MCAWASISTPNTLYIIYLIISFHGPLTAHIIHVLHSYSIYSFIHPISNQTKIHISIYGNATPFLSISDLSVHYNSFVIIKVILFIDQHLLVASLDWRSHTFISLNVIFEN